MKDFTIALTGIFSNSIPNRTGLRHILALGLSILLLAACSTSPAGRSRITTPAPVGNVYSEMDMRIQLATVAAGSTPCNGDECSLNASFDEQIRDLGTRLTQSAFDIYPELSDRVRNFEFVIAEKEDLGSASNATGTIVIFRGAQKNHLDEKALAFLLAREMGHIIGRHHDENAAPRIMLSVLTAVIFPAITIFRNSAALANAATATSATTATTAATAAASTATSYIGSKLILASLKPDQLKEADVIALKLLEGLGWNHHEIASALESSTQINESNAWSEDFRISVAHVKTLEEESNVTDSNPDTQLSYAQDPQETMVESDELLLAENEASSTQESIEVVLNTEESAGPTDVENIPEEAVPDVSTITAQPTVNKVGETPYSIDTKKSFTPKMKGTTNLVRAKTRGAKAPNAKTAQRTGKRANIARKRTTTRTLLSQANKGPKVLPNDDNLGKKTHLRNIVKVSRTIPTQDKAKQSRHILKAAPIRKKIVGDQKTIKMAETRQWRNSVPRE